MDPIKPSGKAYPELLADLADFVAAALVQRGTPVEQAADIGFDVAEGMRKNWAGLSVYMPKGMQYLASQRDLKIFERFNGRNIAELAREHGLTEVRIYQIIKAIRAEFVRKNQGALF